jgi:hypothetical protein
MLPQYWYEESGKIDHKFYGVFEGGGAKGVAYIGALGAMEEKRCWFRGVAGASTGAITAALVAAGMSPEEIADETDAAFEKLQTKMRRGMSSLQKAQGYFPSNGLRDWLNLLLIKQVARKTGVKSDEAVTFKQLFAATGIELNIVAADLSLRCQIIFSRKETPDCGVADAVVASSSIPFAFASRLLEVGDSEKGQPIHHHTIVDGGVWSNFPMYVFEDDAFREYYEREPRKIESREILGFILDESEGRVPPRGETVKFVEEVEADKFIAKEWSNNKPEEVNVPGNLASRIGAWLLLPFYLLGKLIGKNSGVERGRWPTPRSKWALHLVHSLDGFLGGIHPYIFGGIAFGVVTFGAWKAARWIVNEQLVTIATRDFSEPITYAALLINLLLAGSILAVTILLPYVALLGVAANYILLRSSRRVLYGLVMTFVAGSGAPAWAVEKGNIVFLPIPPNIKTLSFKMKLTEREKLIEMAREKTLEKLAEVLPQRSQTA